MDKSQESRLRDQLAAQRQAPESVDATVLDPVDFVYAGRTLDIHIATEEFTHICPMTGLPDFGNLTVEYVPTAKIVELKSLKYYLLQYRQVGIFYEHVVFRILDDLVAAVQPQTLSVRYDVRSRGGIQSTVTARWPEPA